MLSDPRARRSLPIAAFAAGQPRERLAAGATRSAPASRSASPVSAAASARVSRPATPRPASRAIPGAAGAMFTNYILGMVLIESIAIYGLVIGFLLRQDRLGRSVPARKHGPADLRSKLRRRAEARAAGLTPLNSRAETVPPPGVPRARRPPVPLEGCWRACPAARRLRRASACQLAALRARSAARSRLRREPRAMSVSEPHAGRVTARTTAAA